LLGELEQLLAKKVAAMQSQFLACHDSIFKHLAMSLAVMETEVLSDEQIDTLLQEAEGRLRAKAGALATKEPADELNLALDEEQPEPTKRRPIPKLQSGIDLKSYIRDNRGVAQVAPQRFALEQQHNSGTDLRSVEYNQQSKKEVRYIIALSFFERPSMRKYSSQSISMQISISF
jgi:hypothetical protein